MTRLEALEEVVKAAKEAIVCHQLLWQGDPCARAEAAKAEDKFDAALKALAPAPPSGWRTISEAPRDGTRVLLERNGVAYSGCYDQYMGAWVDDGKRRRHPNHWMPLPEGPK